MGFTSLAMFMFPRNLRGNRIPPPEKVREAIEAEKKAEMRPEESAPKFKGKYNRTLTSHRVLAKTDKFNRELLIPIEIQTFPKQSNAN